MRCSEDDRDVVRFVLRLVERCAERSVLRCAVRSVLRCSARSVVRRASRSVVRCAARAEVRVGVRPVERAEAYEVERDDACEAALVRDLEPLRCCECVCDCVRVCERALELSLDVECEVEAVRGWDVEVAAEPIRGWDVERECPASVRLVPVPRVARNCLSPRLGIYFPWAFKASTSSPPTTVTSPAPMVITMSPGSTRLIMCGTTSMRRGT